MRILVTGSSGFIGKHLTTALENQGDRVVPFDRPGCDVTDRQMVFRACERAEAVINLAGVLGTPELFGDERLAVEANITGALNVYDAAKRMGIPVVQIGTGHKGQPNPYAITKGCAEDLGLARAQWCGEKITVVRAFHAYGSWQLPGPPHGYAKVRKFFPTFACYAIEGMPLKLYGGDQLIDPVHVTDVAAVLAAEVHQHAWGAVVEAGNGKEVPVWQVARDIAERAGSDSEIIRAGIRPGEPELAITVASDPACVHPWPYLVDSTIAWYRRWLKDVRAC